MLDAGMLGAVAGGALRVDRRDLGVDVRAWSAGRTDRAPVSKFHRIERSVHKLLRALDQESREAVRAADGSARRAVDVGASEGLRP